MVLIDRNLAIFLCWGRSVDFCESLWWRDGLMDGGVG